MRRLRPGLLAMTVALVTTYVTMAEVNRGDDGPRTFVAALAAVTLGAWLYSVARGDGNGRRCHRDREGGGE